MSYSKFRLCKKTSGQWPGRFACIEPAFRSRQLRYCTVAPRPPIIDTHIHLFDPSRPQGVPWPPKESKIYRTTLPTRYRELASPFGVAGAIAIECSPWLADNQWLLETARTDKIMLGVIGDLEPGTPDFRQHLQHFAKDPLFRGIRYGNLWGRDLSQKISDASFIADLKFLAEANLVLDTANPNPALINAVVRLSDRVPDLTVVLDHLPGMRMPADPPARKACQSDLATLGSRPRVVAKISGFVRVVDGQVREDLPFYREQLDLVWNTFGPDRCMYGSDWPNSEQWASYSQVFHLADTFISNRDPGTIDKFYRTNAEAVYRLSNR
jgi:L-fuconolactonase